ncbi:SDR family oxidoreductase [Phytohabitans flavus]|uniref:Short-chain dehydrogenase/reductase n=1 Tax=Phytohabitans flavus TaxID=1076124 RepID=A0A6F8XLJ3_9ACTN|nr:SDR family oxidoreductase [Phytohabitans flavus]BCB74668.1 short-chain dehydrogenase/reductase [Phytohabitans flavus]
MGTVTLRDAVVFVSGANRGIGRALAREFVARGAAKVYGGARDPKSIEDPGVIAVPLDVTDPDKVEAAARACGDTTILVNNAGIFRRGPLLAADSIQDARDEMATNFFGTLLMTRAFAPVLGRNGGGAIVNLLSVLSFVNFAPWGSYSASKAAAWSLTNSTRDELAGQGTHVMGVHSALVDTDMTDGLNTMPKLPVEVFAGQTLDGLEAGRSEILLDDFTREMKGKLASLPAA